MKYAAIIAGIAVVALIVFFFPKISGEGYCPSGGAVCAGPYIGLNQSPCVGFPSDTNFLSPQNCVDCGSKYYCYGIVKHETKCYGMFGRTQNSTMVEFIDCKIPSDWAKWVALCPSCKNVAEEYSYNQSALQEKFDSEYEKYLVAMSRIHKCCALDYP